MKFRLPKPVRDWIRKKEKLFPDNWIEVSECCGAPRWRETDICDDCKEHSGFMEVNY